MYIHIHIYTYIYIYTYILYVQRCNPHCNALQCTATHQQHTATHCNLLQHTHLISGFVMFAVKFHFVDALLDFALVLRPRDVERDICS